MHQAKQSGNSLVSWWRRHAYRVLYAFAVRYPRTQVYQVVAMVTQEYGNGECAPLMRTVNQQNATNTTDTSSIKTLNPKANHNIVSITEMEMRNRSRNIPVRTSSTPCHVCRQGHGGEILLPCYSWIDRNRRINDTQCRLSRHHQTTQDHQSLQIPWTDRPAGGGHAGAI